MSTSKKREDLPTPRSILKRSSYVHTADKENTNPPPSNRKALFQPDATLQYYEDNNSKLPGTAENTVPMKLHCGGRSRHEFAKGNNQKLPRLNQMSPRRKKTEDPPEKRRNYLAGVVTALLGPSPLYLPRLNRVCEQSSEEALPQDTAQMSEATSSPARKRNKMSSPSTQGRSSKRRRRKIPGLPNLSIRRKCDCPKSTGNVVRQEESNRQVTSTSSPLKCGRTWNPKTPTTTTTATTTDVHLGTAGSSANREATVNPKTTTTATIANPNDTAEVAMIEEDCSFPPVDADCLLEEEDESEPGFTDKSTQLCGRTFPSSSEHKRLDTGSEERSSKEVVDAQGDFQTEEALVEATGEQAAEGEVQSLKDSIGASEQVPEHSQHLMGISKHAQKKARIIANAGNHTGTGTLVAIKDYRQNGCLKVVGNGNTCMPDAALMLTDDMGWDKVSVEFLGYDNDSFRKALFEGKFLRNLSNPANKTSLETKVIDGARDFVNGLVKIPGEIPSVADITTLFEKLNCRLDGGGIGVGISNHQKLLQIKEGRYFILFKLVYTKDGSDDEFNVNHAVAYFADPHKRFLVDNSHRAKPTKVLEKDLASKEAAQDCFLEHLSQSLQCKNLKLRRTKVLKVLRIFTPEEHQHWSDKKRKVKNWWKNQQKKRKRQEAREMAEAMAEMKAMAVEDPWWAELLAAQSEESKDDDDPFYQYLL